MEICSDNELDELKILKKLYFSQNIIKVHLKAIFESTFWEKAHFDFDKKAAQYLFGFPCSQVQRGFPNNSLQVFAENYSQKTSHVDNKSKMIQKYFTC